MLRNDMESFRSVPKRMHSPGINAEGELRGQPVNPGSPGKYLLKRSVCGSGLSGYKRLNSGPFWYMVYVIDNDEFAFVHLFKCEVP